MVYKFMLNISIMPHIKKEYYLNGNLKFENSYIGNKRHGMSRWFRESGYKWDECMFDNGSKRGILRVWDCYGHIDYFHTIKEVFQHGIEIWFIY